MSDKKMVSVPREPTREMLTAAREVNGIFPTWRAMVDAAPAEQHHGEPVDLNSLRATGISQVATGWNKCIDRLQNQFGHLYTHADPAEVERLSAVIEQQKNLIESLRAELVESNSIDDSAGPSAPELTEDLREILGRPNFTCHLIAKALRVMGHSIAHKSEDEQAVVIHWLLGIYLKHGPDWRQRAAAELEEASQSLSLIETLPPNTPATRSSYLDAVLTLDAGAPSTAI